MQFVYFSLGVIIVCGVIFFQDEIIWFKRPKDWCPKYNELGNMGIVCWTCVATFFLWPIILPMLISGSLYHRRKQRNETKRS